MELHITVSFEEIYLQIKMSQYVSWINNRNLIEQKLAKNIYF